MPVHGEKNARRVSRNPSQKRNHPSRRGSRGSHIMFPSSSTPFDTRGRGGGSGRRGVVPDVHQHETLSCLRRPPTRPSSDRPRFMSFPIRLQLWRGCRRSSSGLAVTHFLRRWRRPLHNWSRRRKGMKHGRTEEGRARARGGDARKKPSSVVVVPPFAFVGCI